MLKKYFAPKYIPFSLLILTIIISILVTLLPSEKTLGKIIKVVFVHATLLQTGLLIFIFAGSLGLINLFKQKKIIEQWCLAAQKTGVIFWLVCIISSIVVSYYAWGIAVSWNEPRVQANILILVIATSFLMLTIGLNRIWFISIANMTLAVIAFILIKTATNVRHPINPIGNSNLLAYKILFLLMLVSFLLFAFQMIRLLVNKSD